MPLQMDFMVFETGAAREGFRSLWKYADICDLIWLH